jgi:hypothetical protein
VATLLPARRVSIDLPPDVVPPLLQCAVIEVLRLDNNFPAGPGNSSPAVEYQVSGAGMASHTPPCRVISGESLMQVVALSEDEPNPQTDQTPKRD